MFQMKSNVHVQWPEQHNIRYGTAAEGYGHSVVHDTNHACETVISCAKITMMQFAGILRMHYEYVDDIQYSSHER